MSHYHHKKIIDIASAIVLLALIMLDAVLWRNIFIARSDAGIGATGGDVGSAAGGTAVPRIYFLPVAQGESALLVLPGDVTVLTDAGSDDSIVDDLQKVLPSGAPPYIDLAILSYPQSADYEGYEYVLQHYQIGAFVYNGRADVAHRTEWNQLMAAIAAKHVPLITVGAGNRIRFGAATALAEIDILSPSAAFARSPEPSDTGIVQRVITQKFTALLAADIGVNVEDALLARATHGAATRASSTTHTSLRANILKAPFPGLGASAGDAFLRAVAPHTIVIVPGIKNTASAPTKAMLAYVASSTALSTKATIVVSKPGVFLLYNK
jgi:beta-lactamase superfamily II metal-dependent hydrolase